MPLPLVEHQGQHARLKEDGGAAPTVDVENASEVLELTAQIAAAEKDAEKAGEEGNVDESMKLMEAAEALKKRKAETQAKLVTSSAGGLSELTTTQKLRVCEVCGALLSIFDSDQ